METTLLGLMKLLFILIGRNIRRHPWQYGLFGLVTLATTGLWIIEPLYASYAVDRMLKIKDGVDVNLPMIFLWWGVLFLAISVVQTIDKFLTWRLRNLTELERASEVYNHVLELDIAFHTKQKSGEVVKILDEGAENVAELQGNLLADFLPSLLAAIVFLIIGYRIDPFLAVILVGAIALYMSIVVIGSTYTMKLQRIANKIWVERIGHAYDAVTNIFSVKSGAQENRELNTFEEKNRQVFASQMRVNKRWAAVEALNIFMLTRMLLIGIGALLYIQNQITLGELYFFQASFFRVLTPFEVLSGIVPFWNKRVGKVRMSEELLKTKVYVENSADAKTLPELKGEIRFEDVSFSYREVIRTFDIEDEHTTSSPSPVEDQKATDEQPHPIDTPREHVKPESSEAPKANYEALRGISLTIKPGEHIALVGHSGAGKSTIAMLLNRFYDPTSGSIIVDDVNLKDLDVHWWRSSVGLVLQDNITFNETIRMNIAYARPSATEEEIIDAAKRAAAHDFISRMPNGYDTLVGDRGVRLSGGERQRVSIARAILKQPKIVMLDEATSALDSVTERHVQNGIKELISGRTAVIIAHRLSTVRSVDRIAVLDKGKLIACAPHEELLKTCDIYKEMVELQSQGMLAE